MVFNTAWISSTSTLGPTKEEPMFQVQTPSRINCFGNKHTILKDGLDKLAAPLASVGKEKGNGWRKSHSLIQVSGRGGGPDLSIRMENDYSNTHPFTMPIHGQETRFEWRNTSGGAEIKNLSGGYNWGWKLVRLTVHTAYLAGGPSFPKGSPAMERRSLRWRRTPSCSRRTPNSCSSAAARGARWDRNSRWWP